MIDSLCHRLWNCMHLIDLTRWYNICSVHKLKLGNSLSVRASLITYSVHVLCIILYGMYNTIPAYMNK